jgi:hypothetical protein
MADELFNGGAAAVVQSTGSDLPGGGIWTLEGTDDLELQGPLVWFPPVAAPSLAERWILAMSRPARSLGLRLSMSA